MFAALVTFLVTIAFLLALRPLAGALRLVDHPGGRKHHLGAIPVIGGLAVFIGVTAGLVVIGGIGELTAGMLFSMFMLVLVGAIDDAIGVPPVVRLLIHVAAVIIMAEIAGLMLFSLGNPFGFGEILLGPFALVGTLMVAITVINAYNLIDGADGLAGTLALIPLLAVVLLSGEASSSHILAMILAASVLAFLVFNFPAKANRPIRTFLGDAGSTMIGFVVFWSVLGVSQGEGAVISPVAGLWLASIPIYDSLTCFVRRLLKRKSPFTPGRDHFHHTLIRGGFDMRQKLAILGGLQLLYAAVGVSAPLLGVPDVALFAAWSVLGLTQLKVLRLMSTLHRHYMQKKLKACAFSRERAERIRSLR